MFKKYYLLSIQILAYLSLIPMLQYGTLVEWGIFAAMYFGMLCLGSTVYFHRYLAHKSFDCPVFWQYVFLFFGHINLAGSAIQWVAMHRQHHKFAETDKDPHSPMHKGYLRTHFLHTLFETDMKYVRDLVKDTKVVLEHRHYWKLMLLWITVLLLIDPAAIIYAWLAPAGLSRLAVGLILSYSHRGGYTHNDEWVGWITFGEGWHTNHHDNPSNPMWHETKDIGWWIIKCLK